MPTAVRAAVPFNGAKDRLDLGTSVRRRAARKVEGDIDDHVLLTADHPAATKLDQYFSCIDAIVGARLLGVWEEGGIDPGIPETESFAIDPDRAILKRATKLFGRVHQAVQVAAMLPPLPIGCGDKDLKRGVAGSGAHSREAGIDPDCSNWIFCFRRYPGT